MVSHRAMAVGAVVLAVGLWLLLVPLLASAPRIPTAAIAGVAPESATWARRYGWSLALLSIVVVGLGLRFVLLTEMPASLFRDEGRHALRAAKLLDDPAYRPVYEPDIDLPALFLYPLAGAFKLFGVSLLTLRGFMAVMGALSVALLGVLGRQLFGPRVGLIAAALFAASFWGLRMGRVGLVPSFSTAVVLLALVLFVRALHTRRYADFALAGLVAAGCANVYHSSPFALFLMLGVAVALIVRESRVFTRQWLGRFALFAVCCLAGLTPLLSFTSRATRRRTCTDPARLLSSRRQICAASDRIASPPLPIISHRTSVWTPCAATTSQSTTSPSHRTSTPSPPLPCSRGWHSRSRAAPRTDVRAVIRANGQPTANNCVPLPRRALRGGMARGNAYPQPARD